MDDKSGGRRLLIVGETIEGRLTAATERMAGQVRQWEACLNAHARGVLTGHRIDAAARTWSREAGIPVIVLDDPRLRYPDPAMTAAGIEPLILADSPLAVCLPHSMRACQTAAALAWRLKAACVTAVDAMTANGSRMMLGRTIQGGRLRESLSTDGRPLILTVTPEAASGAPQQPGPAFAPSVTTVTPPASDDRCVPRAVRRQARTDEPLHRARVVVAGGRGLGGPERVGLLARLAGMFKDAAVGASRGACDLGWLPHGLQVGETGRTIAPALYLACGISGAPQHLAGMRDAQTIVAVNSDPKAAIFTVAHYGVVEDLAAFLPLLLETYARTLRQGERE